MRVSEFEEHISEVLWEALAEEGAVVAGERGCRCPELGFAPQGNLFETVVQGLGCGLPRRF